MTLAWGARGIIESDKVSLLADRQDSRGENIDELIEQLNSGLLGELLDVVNRKLSVGEWDSSTCEDYFMERGKVKLKANPKGSFGYVYIVGYME